MLEAAARFLIEQDDILFMAHVSPDGDTLGSCFALYQMALQMGKRAEIACEEPVPQIYRFLPYADVLKGPYEVRQGTAVMCVDCADAERTGQCAFLLQRASHTFNIDHHATNKRYAEGNYVDEAAAAGELVYALLLRLGLTLTRDIASCLFAAIATDTGNFAYSNTTAETFRTVAALMEAGIPLPELNRRLFRTVPYRKVRLRGLAINKVTLFAEGKAGISFITYKELRQYDATDEDAEGIIDVIRDIDTVEVAAFLRESADGRIRVSLRGKAYANVGAIAVGFGGGGHHFAAGCTLDMSMEQALGRVREAIEAALSGEKA